MIIVAFENTEDLRIENWKCKNDEFPNRFVHSTGSIL